MTRDPVTIPTLDQHQHLPRLPIVQPRDLRELTKCNIVYLDEYGEPMNRIIRLMHDSIQCSPSVLRPQVSEIPECLGLS